MSDQELIDQLRGVVRQVEREAAATELYLKGQIRTLKEQINEDNKKAFQGGWVARDSLGVTTPYDMNDGDEWFDAWKKDEERRL